MSKNSTNTNNVTVNDVYTANKLLSNTLAQYMNNLVFNEELNMIKSNLKADIDGLDEKATAETVKQYAVDNADLFSKVELELIDGIDTLDDVDTLDKFDTLIKKIRRPVSFWTKEDSFKVLVTYLSSPEDYTKKERVERIQSWLVRKFGFNVNDKLANKLITYITGYVPKSGSEFCKALFENTDADFKFVKKRSASQIEKLMISALIDLTYDKTLKKAQLSDRAIELLELKYAEKE